MLLGELEECYRLPLATEPGRHCKSRSADISFPKRATTASLLAAQCTQDRSGHDLANQLKPGWARFIEFSHPLTCEALEQLIALPPRERFLTALRPGSEVTPDLIFALIDLASALRARHLFSASSLAQTALALTSRLPDQEPDLLFVLNEQSAMWMATAEENLFNDRLANVDLYLKVAESLATTGRSNPALAARIGMARAQLYWQQANIEACLTEVNAALIYCEVAGDNGMTGAVLFLKGVTLATTGTPSGARRCLERSLTLLPGSSHHWVTRMAEFTLEGLDELI